MESRAGATRLPGSLGRMDIMQVLAALGPQATASHETAARLWGIELVETGSARVTVAR